MGYLYSKNLEIHRLKIERDSLEEYKDVRRQAIINENNRLLKHCESKINEHIENINRIETKIKYMRENTEEDINERLSIKSNYSKTIKENIPDYSPIVFYGIDNIGSVKLIIDQGTLIPAISNNKGKIFVTNKDNIRPTLGNADPGALTYMPYGAIFAFKPLKEEVKDVYQATSSEFEIENMDIKANIDRLYGIITTNENVPRIQNWCLEYGIPIEKVFNHEDFVKNIHEIMNKKVR